MTPPGPPDSRPPRRGKRPPSISDTIDEADERAQAAAAVIERDVREAAAATAAAIVAAEMAFPRQKTPADAELAKAIAQIRADAPEWQLAENMARALEALAARIDDGERRAAADVVERERQAAAAAKEAHEKRERWAPLWRALKAGATAIALTIGGFAVNALINHGDSRRAAAQQAAVIDKHTAAIERLTEVVTADHPIVQIVAARLGMAAPAYPSPSNP